MEIVQNIPKTKNIFRILKEGLVIEFTKSLKVCALWEGI
jgi:hypothetical protein